MENPPTKQPFLSFVCISIKYHGNIETEQSKKMQTYQNDQRYQSDQNNKWKQ